MKAIKVTVLCVIFLVPMFMSSFVCAQDSIPSFAEVINYNTQLPGLVGEGASLETIVPITGDKFLRITYNSEGLAESVFTETGIRVVDISYLRDSSGNIISTKLVYSQWHEQTYAGLVNVTDLMIESIDSIKTAIGLLYDTVNPDEFLISDFYVQSDGSLIVEFDINDDSEEYSYSVLIVVDTGTGIADFAFPYLRYVVDDVRQKVAAHMNVGIDQVHVNHIYSDPNPYWMWHSTSYLIVRVGNFELHVSWSPQYYYNGYTYPETFELLYVKNLVTGIDVNTYVWETLGTGFIVADWVFTENQVLHLSLLLYDGMTIDVNMSTAGEIWLQDNLGETILKVRNEAAKAFNIDISQTYLYGLTKDISNIYTINIATIPDPANWQTFFMSFSYNPVTGKTKLKGITSEAGINYLEKAEKYLSSNFYYYQNGYFDFDSVSLDGDMVVLRFTKHTDFSYTDPHYIVMKADINTGVIRESIEVIETWWSLDTTTQYHDENGTLRRKVWIEDIWYRDYFVESPEGYTFYINAAAHGEYVYNYDENGVLRDFISNVSVFHRGDPFRILETWTGFRRYYGNGNEEMSHFESLRFNYQDGGLQYRDIWDEERQEDGRIKERISTHETYEEGVLVQSETLENKYNYKEDGKDISEKRTRSLYGAGGLLKEQTIETWFKYYSRDWYIRQDKTFTDGGALLEEKYEAYSYYASGVMAGKNIKTDKYENGKLIDSVSETIFYKDNGEIQSHYLSHTQNVYQNGVLKESKFNALSYDAAGNLRSSYTSIITYENGAAIRWSVESLVYENGILKTRTNGESTYAAGRLQFTMTTTLTYNTAGMCLKKEYRAYSYYSSGMLAGKNVSTSKYENNKLVDYVNETYFYGTNGELASHYLSHTVYTYQNGIIKESRSNTLSYDKLGNILSSWSSVVTYENGVVVKYASESLKYENNKLVQSINCTYLYYKTGRLSSYVRNTVTYGAGGNIIERKYESRAYNQNGTISWESVMTQKYDSKGNIVEMIGQSKGYDQMGKLTSTSSYTLVSTYDANNILRLQKVESLSYDGQGRPTYSYNGLYKYNESGRISDLSGSRLSYKNGVLAEESSWQYIYDVSTSRIAGATIRVIKYDDAGRMVSDCTTISRYNANGVLTYRYITTKTYSSDGRILDESTRAATSINSSGIVTAERVIGSKPIYGYFTYNNQVVYYQIGTEKYFIDSFYNDSGILTNRRISVQECDVSGKVVEDYVKYTTQVDANGVIREEKILNGKKYGWAGGTWQRLISYTITFQYDAAGKLISEAGNKYNSAGVKIEEYTRTVSNVFGSVTEVVHKNIYNDLGQMIDEYTVTFERLHYSDGDILRQRIEGTKYDMLGNVIENYNSGVSEWDAYGNAIQEFAQGIRFDADGHVIDMYNITRSYVAGSSGKDRMPSPYPNLPQGILSAQVIEGKQVYADTGYVKEWYKITATHIGCDGTIYEERAEGEIFGQDGSSYGTYTILTNYDPDGKITNKSGSITLYNAASQERIFTIRYDISAGAVTYTHVYDIAGNEVLDLGGSGLIAPFDIAKRYYGPGSPLDPKEALPKTAVQDDTSVADRLDLQNAAQDQGNMPSGVTITGSLAGNPLDTGYSQLQ